MNAAMWYPLRKQNHLKLISGNDVLTSAPHEDPPNSRSVGSKIAAHLDVGTIVIGVIGFLMIFVLNQGIMRLEKINDQVVIILEKMATMVTRNDYQEKSDEAQNKRLDRLEEALARRPP